MKSVLKQSQKDTHPTQTNIQIQDSYFNKKKKKKERKTQRERKTILIQEFLEFESSRVVPGPLSTFMIIIRS